MRKQLYKKEGKYEALLIFCNLKNKTISAKIRKSRNCYLKNEYFAAKDGILTKMF